MAMLHPVRKACPACGKPMKVVPDEASEGRSRYVCTNCNLTIVLPMVRFVAQAQDPFEARNALEYRIGRRCDRRRTAPRSMRDRFGSKGTSLNWTRWLLL